MRGRLALALGALASLPVGAAASGPFWVSASGDDASGDGSRGAPWRSWSGAAARVRPLLPAMAADLFVFFEPGSYALASSIVLGEADSGRKCVPVFPRDGA